MMSIRGSWQRRSLTAMIAGLALALVAGCSAEDGTLQTVSDFVFALGRGALSAFLL